LLIPIIKEDLLQSTKQPSPTYMR